MDIKIIDTTNTEDSVQIVLAITYNKPTDATPSQAADYAAAAALVAALASKAAL